MARSWVDGMSTPSLVASDFLIQQINRNMGKSAVFLTHFSNKDLCAWVGMLRKARRLILEPHQYSASSAKTGHNVHTLSTAVFEASREYRTDGTNHCVNVVMYLESFLDPLPPKTFVRRRIIFFCENPKHTHDDALKLMNWGIYYLALFLFSPDARMRIKDTAEQEEGVSAK